MTTPHVTETHRHGHDHAPRYTCRFYEWDDVGAPYGWHVLLDGVILDTYRDREMAESYVRYMNANHA